MSAYREPKITFIGVRPGSKNNVYRRTKQGKNNTKNAKSLNASLRERCKDRLFPKVTEAAFGCHKGFQSPQGSQIGFKIGEKIRVFPWQNNVYRRSDFCRQGEDSVSWNNSLGPSLKTHRIGAEERERVFWKLSSADLSRAW